MSIFKESIIRICKAIPEGALVSYGQVALMVGVPRGARQVGWILNKLPPDSHVPWWRVINNKGMITIKGSFMTAEDQKELIEKEGIIVTDDYKIDIEKYRWRPTVHELGKFELDGEYIDIILNKYTL